MDESVFMAWLMLLVGCGAGYFAAARGTRRTVQAQGSIPGQWPLDPRRLVSAEERRVWHWLGQVFPDHRVQVKVAVTRFLLPRQGENSRQLYELLNGVHCTFTVCGHDGRVVGCLDVPGPKGISHLNRQLKFSLLAQCGIMYRVVQPDALPKASDIRLDFLGDDALALFARERERVAVSHAQRELRTGVERRRRHHRPDDRGAHAQVGEGGDSVFDPESASGAWQQPNSFLVPLDSRPAGLQ